ncbi:methyl-accepting chemotaxis protein [Pontivivens ytuae]|uniref:Methyl-accepting transducer domain-containing protein n=1 Tax=Pontivivens ytuae TaxID=2789856 RepID=A0A7S9LQH3_9RHOB|nr:methyl-accepting chemotaxis protein [Pontivivens ytuae]QPH53431.1 hypothetical protein I0K15_16830 [Pontivivens ytuae]
MTDYRPTFETEISPDLFRSDDPAAAMRAVAALPIMVRTQILRILMFLGGVILTEDREIRDGSFAAMKLAFEGVDNALDILSGWQSRRDLNPEARQVLATVMADHAGSLNAPRELRGRAERMAERALRGDRPTSAEYDALLRWTYSSFHPEMLALSSRMKEAGDAMRRSREDAAHEARHRAVDARDRIDTIARTVRLISLNARVEAARAGAAGRAFGVIADEIKSLSEQTEKVSAEIGTSVDEIMANFRIV